MLCNPTQTTFLLIFGKHEVKALICIQAWLPKRDLGLTLSLLLLKGHLMVLHLHGSVFTAERTIHTPTLCSNIWAARLGSGLPLWIWLRQQREMNTSHYLRKSMSISRLRQGRLEIHGNLTGNYIVKPEAAELPATTRQYSITPLSRLSRATAHTAAQSVIADISNAIRCPRVP